MFTSLFGSARQLSRFEKCTEFSQVFPLLKELHNKNGELEIEARKYGASSIGYLKHKIILKVKNEINSKITQFNSYPSHLNQFDEMKDIMVLADDLTNIIMQTLTMDKDSLLIPRNNQRKMVNAALDLATVGGSVAVAMMSSPMPLIAVPAAFLSSSMVSQYTRSAIGISNIAPRSACILFEMVGHLVLMNKNISISLGLNPERYDQFIGQIIKLCEEVTHSEQTQEQKLYERELLSLNR